MHLFLFAVSLSFLSLTFTGCQSQKSPENPRRKTQLFQEATGPVVVYPTDPNRRPKNRDPFMLPPKAEADLNIRPPAAKVVEDLKPISPPPQTIKRIPPPKVIPSPKSKLPERFVTTHLTKRDVQFLLKELGFYEGSLDGVHGPQTKRAIKNFQAQNSLRVDGIAGPKTKKAMLQAIQQAYKKNSGIE